MAEPAKQARLRWRCRRGMRELDLMLLAWLERRYGEASPSEQQAFERLLDLEDDRLFSLLLGGAEPEDALERRLCHEIRDFARPGR